MTLLHRTASPLALAAGLALGVCAALSTGNERAALRPTGLDAVRIWREGDVSHLYYVPLRAGEHLRVAAEQRGSDVVLEVLAPGEQAPVAVDGYTDATGVDDFELVAKTAGAARIRIVLGQVAATVPAYRIESSAPRPASEIDRLRASAFGAIEQAKALPRQEAVATLEAALRRAERAAAPDLEALVHDRLGRRLPEDDPSKIGHFRAAAARAVDPSLKCAELRRLGITLGERNEKAEAEEAFRTERKIALSARDPARFAFALLDLAQFNKGAGRFDEALALYRQALAIWRRLGNRDQQALTLRYLASTSIDLGDHQQAKDAYAMALKVPGLPPALEVDLLDGLAHSYRRMEQWEPANEIGNRALAGARRLGDRELEGSCRLTLASIALDTGQPKLALRHLLPAERIFENEVEDPSALANTFAMLGPALERTGEVSASLPYFDRAIEAYRRLGNDGYRAWVLSHRSDALRKARRFDEAEADLEAAIAILESLRPALDPRSRADLLADRHAFFEQLIDLQIERRRPRAAFEASERSRGRTLLDLVSGRPGAAPRTLAEIMAGLPPRGLLLEYSLGTRRSVLFVVRREGLSWVLLPAQERIEGLAAEATRTFGRPPGVMRREEREAKIAALAATLLSPISRRLTGDTVVVVPDGALFSVPFAALPIPGASDDSGTRLVDRAQVVTLPSASLALEIRDAVARRTAADQGLFAVADPVFGCPDSRIVCAAEQSGSREATVPGQWVASVRSLLGSETVGRRGEAAEERLSRIVRTGSEVAAIAKLAGTGSATFRVGFGASRDGVLGVALERFRILHFATHGLVDPERPDRSGLALTRVDVGGRKLAGDPFLRVGDLSASRLRSDLVVLSACESALGKEKRGEGPQSLGRAFLAAGAANALVSLWRVDDSSTEDLMVGFYRRLLGQGLAPAEALRQSQVAVRSRPGWADPYYWGAFVLQGDWGASSSGSRAARPDSSSTKKRP